MAPSIWTIGHSTRPLDEFLGLLVGSSIGLVADVRRFPGSKRYPHFNAEALAGSLKHIGISYRHIPGLGGRRGKSAPDSPNGAWRNDSFNAFADHMATSEFSAALDELTSLALDGNVVIMCSEAVPWRCHRRLIADALTVRNWSVFDVVGPRKIDLHALTDFARVNGTTLTYPAEPLLGDGSDSGSALP